MLSEHAHWLKEWRQAGLFRERQTVHRPEAAFVEIDGKRYLNFCSNDYLGMSKHPAVIEAMQRAIAEYGVGAGASHLVTGHTAEHEALEADIAEHLRCEKALLFSSGYAANLGVQSALLSRHDTVLHDKLNHASLLDGAKLSSANLKRYKHGDAEHLGQLLLKYDNVKLIASDAVFSMDGDIAPLPALQTAAAQYGAALLVDDAHGYGVLGSNGSGSVDQLACRQDESLLQVITLGKAVGVVGAAVVGSHALIDRIAQSARPYVYTTALPAACAAAARASIVILRDDDTRRQHLLRLIARFRELAALFALPLMPSSTPIQPLLVGDNDQAMALSEALKNKGFWVAAIRPPTVPVGSSRLRITLSASHSFEQVERLVDALTVAYSELSS